MKKLLFLVLAVFMMGCAASVSLYREPFPAKADYANIDVYRTAKPDKAYIEIGELKFNSSSDTINIKKLKKAARKMGADGIIIIGGAGQNGAGIAIGKIVMIGSEEKGMKAVAIKYK
jgi:hypothetical protein